MQPQVFFEERLSRARSPPTAPLAVAAVVVAVAEGVAAAAIANAIATAVVAAVAVVVAVVVVVAGAGAVVADCPPGVVRAIRAQHACVVLASFLRVLERACRLPPLLLTTPGVWFTERGEIVVVTAMTAVSRARRTCGHGAFVIVHGVWWRRRRQWQHCGVSSPSPNAGQVAAAAAALVAAGAAVQSEQVQEARSKNLCWRRVDQHPPRRRAAEDVERSRLVVARAPGECQHFHLQLRRRSFWSAIEAQGAGSV